jgi:transposase InsO family protein
MGITIKKALSIAGLTKHQYYYKPKQGKPGRNPSSHVIKMLDKEQSVMISNEVMVDEIISIQLTPELYYGYRAMTRELNMRGYIVNHKKIYRLMDKYHLLQDKSTKAKRRYVKYRSVIPDHPLQYLEMDIKFQWVEEHQRFAFILTVIDCFTRHVLAWTVAYSIKQNQVKQLWNQIINDYLQPNDMLNKKIHVELRNDNDSRFAAKSVQEYFSKNHINQVFTHPYTPQENGHIESFHSILSRSLSVRRFSTIMELETHLITFYNSYNNIRLHGSLDHLPPSLFWRLWNDQLIEIVKLKHNKQRFKLKIPHYQLSGNGYLREVSCLPKGHQKEVYDVMTLQQPSVQRSPSVVSC